MSVKDFLLSWDFIFSAALTVVVGCVLPSEVGNRLAKDLYGVGISVLSIVFSVFFASLAILMSSSDDEFVQFLEEEGDYTAIISSFAFSLGALFAALLASIGLYGVTAYLESRDVPTQNRWWLVAFTLLFSYGLCAVANASYDSIVYSKLRTRFLRKKGGPL